MKRSGGNGGLVFGGGTDDDQRKSAAISAYAAQVTRLGTGFKNPNTGAQAQVFGAEFNTPSLGLSGWERLDILGETSAFDLSSIPSYREVAGASTLMTNYDPNSGLVHRWYRDNVGTQLLFEYYMPLPNPQPGWTSWWSWMVTYIGYCPWEFWENGNYRVTSFYVDPLGNEEIIDSKQFTISGIPATKIPVSQVQVTLNPPNPSVGDLVTVTARVTNTSAGVYGIYFSADGAYFPISDAAIMLGSMGQMLIGGGQFRNATGDFTATFTMPASGGEVHVNVYAYGNNGTNDATELDTVGIGTVPNPSVPVWLKMGTSISISVSQTDIPFDWTKLGLPVVLAVSWVDIGFDWVKLGLPSVVTVAMTNNPVDWVKMGIATSITVTFQAVVPPPGGGTPGWVLPAVVIGGAALVGIVAASESGKKKTKTLAKNVF